MRLSACLLTFNEDRWIDLCIEHMYDYVDEIVCLDGGSTDNTISILRRYNKVSYYVIPQPTAERGGKGWNEGDRRNILQDSACGDWILVLGCDELLDDAVWENLDDWLSKYPSVLGYGFYRINYIYDLNHHKPIHQPPNGGEVRIFRNVEGIKWETNNAHNFLCFKGQRMYDRSDVINTRYLIHHMHRIGIRGHKPEFDRRNGPGHYMKEDYVKKPGFQKTEDNNYFREIKYPLILKEKGIL